MNLENLKFGKADVPTQCKKCGGIMIYAGVGEYKCEDCQHIEMDDYGKVRRDIEEHHGATAADISSRTGVPQRRIRHLLQEERLEVAPDSRIYMECELCKAQIRTGRYCEKCAAQVEAAKRQIEKANKKPRDLQGISTQRDAAEEGAKRFRRQ